MKNLTIISGGQTGVDRAALDMAIRLGLDYSGWCPKDGWAEDMPEFPGLLICYLALKETPLDNPVQRTKWNVRGSSATLSNIGWFRPFVFSRYCANNSNR